MEFIPYDWFTDAISNFLGFESSEDTEEESEELGRRLEEVGDVDPAESYGDSNIIKNMGIMLLFAAVIAIAVSFLCCF